MQAQITFGSFRFEPASARLWDERAEVKLTRKAALLLGALLERPGTPVSKQELFANVWRGVPFVAITLLAGLQTISPSFYEASAIDGATPWQQFRQHLAEARPVPSPGVTPDVSGPARRRPGSGRAGRRTDSG